MFANWIIFCCLKMGLVGLHQIHLKLSQQPTAEPSLPMGPTECWKNVRNIWNAATVQFSSISSIVLRGKVSERPAWKAESWALLETDCDWWTGSEGEAAVSSRQLELWWRSFNLGASCSGSWNKQITMLSQAETRTAWIVTDCAGNATLVGRPGASDAV